jgi:Cu/Ag efflux protein CusF
MLVSQGTFRLADSSQAECAVAKRSSSSVVPAIAGDDRASGEVMKIDKSARKITLKHGATNLAMDAMAMVFRVSDPVMLDKALVSQCTV